MMNFNGKELATGTAGCALSAVGTAVQTNEILQTISLVLTILGTLITFVILPLFNWYRNAKKDGKIDKEEIKEAVDIVSKGAEEVSKTVNDRKEGD